MVSFVFLGLPVAISSSCHCVITFPVHRASVPSLDSFYSYGMIIELSSPDVSLARSVLGLEDSACLHCDVLFAVLVSFPTSSYWALAQAGSTGLW